MEGERVITFPPMLPASQFLKCDQAEILYVAAMRHTFPLLILLALAGSALAATDLEQEYVQVRKIALKDPKVQAAFQKADERLNEKIIEIDPALKAIVERESLHHQGPQQEAVHGHPVAAAPRPAGREHIVVKGETLTVIAEHYHVTVASLKSANQITDERKLRVGQKLVIPGGTAPTATPKPEATPQDAAKGSKSDDLGSWWDEVKKNL